MRMWVEGGVLYTDRPRQQQVHPGLRPMHRATEFKTDWWLGRTVVRKGVMWTVAGFIPGDKGGYLVLAAPDGHGEQVKLATANKALREGTWELM